VADWRRVTDAWAVADWRQAADAWAVARWASPDGRRRSGVVAAVAGEWGAREGVCGVGVEAGALGWLSVRVKG